jgi:phosphate transport system ATP-binding protein
MPVYQNLVTSIFGPFGSGKSTFLRSFNRMNELLTRTKHSGHITFRGNDIYDSKIDLLQLRAQMGMIFKTPNLFPSSISENIRLGPKIQGEKSASTLDGLVEHYLKKVSLWKELKDRLDQPAYDLSLGQQQRLCIARALAVKPDILLMDEPCSTLDSIETQKIEDFIQEMKKTITILMVTHSMQQAARISDYSAFFYTDETLVSQLIEFDTTRVMFTNPKHQQTTNYITGRFG